MKSRAFTLIELLVVITIIGVLAGLIVLGFNSARRKARTANRLRDLDSLKKALDLYYSDYEAYPNSFGGAGVWDGLYSCWGDSTPDWIAGLVSGGYIPRLPRDPRNHTVCGEQYIYRSDGVDYKLISHQPEDCNSVITVSPNLTDPSRICWAYGYYTDGARNW